MRIPAAFLVRVLVGLVASTSPASAISVDWVLVGDPGNAPASALYCASGAGCGSVAYEYRIARYEVTNAQYAEFLNAKAASDPLALYHTNMALLNGGITRSGADGSYTYEVKPGFADKPVNHVSFWDALRFANWMHNGQGAGDTETGAYTLTPDGIAANSITRNPDATIFLPSEDEWFKAAYYDPIGQGYFFYPAGTHEATACTAPGPTPNTANCRPPDVFPNEPRDVGSYTGSPSPYGTFDQGGNMYEWNEDIVSGATWPSRGHRGGSWASPSSSMNASAWSYHLAKGTSVATGFRLAAVAPEPGPACANGLDDDGDDLVDFPDDPGCADAASSYERTQCQDGLDNDGQAGIDFDGGVSLDLDEDGFIDPTFDPSTPAVGAADPQCVGRPWRNREAASCGLGAELVLLTPVLVGRRVLGRRRRR